MRVLTILSAVALAGCTATAASQHSAQERAAHDLQQALGDRVPGKPVDCIEASRVNGPQVIDEHTVLYRDLGNRIWRAEIPDACPSLHGDPILVVEMHSSQICRDDRFRVLERGSHIPGASCRFGQFTPYDKPH